MFNYDGSVDGTSTKMRFDTGAVKNGTTLHPGQACKKVAGFWDAAVTGDTIDGVLNGHLDIVGDGVLEGHFRLVKGCAFRVSKDLLSDNDTLPGKTVDLKTGGLLPTTDSNSDMRVLKQYLAEDTIRIEFLNPGL